MTTLEIRAARPAPEIEQIVSKIRARSGLVPDIINYTHDRQPRLIKPRISYDSAAIALSFVPAVGEGTNDEWRKRNDRYTYHHLRRDLFDKVTAAGIDVAGRYAVPSAHITIARFISHDGSDRAGNAIDHRHISEFVKRLEEINEGLKFKYWPKDNLENSTRAGEWCVGEEKGLELIKGTIWYGKGEQIHT